MGKLFKKQTKTDPLSLIAHIFVHSGGIQNIKDGNTSVCPTSGEGNSWWDCYSYTLAKGWKTFGHISVYLLSILVEQKQTNRTRRETVSPSPVVFRTTHSVPLGVPFYLSCPIDSYHAVYTWEHGGRSSPCLQMDSNCLHLIPYMAQENYGGYECVSKEKDYTKVVKTYQLTEQIIPESPVNTDTRNTNLDKNGAAVLLRTAWLTLGLAVAVMGIFR